jgi:hypothetical protein
MKYMLMAQLLVLSSLAFGGDRPASCELESKNIVSRSSSGLAQVSNLGDIRITCSVAARAFPTKPGEGRYGLRAATTTYKISSDGSRRFVPSEVQESGGGFGTNPGLVGTNPELEWVVFDVHIPLKPAERDAEARRYLAKVEKLMPGQIPEAARQQAVERTREFVYQHRVGHFRVECRILDGDRVMGVGVVELEVLFKGRFSDVGLPGSPPV